MFLRDLQRAIRRDGLIQPGDHVLLGVSGGADSVALLVGLQSLAGAGDFRLTCAHLDHRLRGAEAVADARFVEALCSDLAVELVTGRHDVRRHARQQGLSLEMAAREARYDFFARTAKQRDANKIATAHTADDQAETVLLKLARGTGMDGLGGIHPMSRRHDVTLIRPLLGICRPELEAFLQANGQAWREDASNRDLAFLRNRVRHELLPWLTQRLNPRTREALCRSAAIIRDDNALLEAYCDDLLPACCPPDASLNLSVFAGLPVAARRRIARRWLAACNVEVSRLSFDTIERLLQLGRRAGGGRASLALGAGERVCREYGCLRLLRPVDDVPAIAVRCRLTHRGETLVRELGLRVVVSLSAGLVKDRCRGPGVLPRPRRSSVASVVSVLRCRRRAAPS